MWGLLDVNGTSPKCFVAFFETQELAEAAEQEWTYFGMSVAAAPVPVIQSMDEVRERQPHWLYAAQRITGGPVKFGVTRNPRARLAQLNAHSIEEIVFVGISGPQKRANVFKWEAWIKRKNQRSQVHGEWFDVTFDVVEAIERMSGTAGCSPLIHDLYADTDELELQEPQLTQE